MWAKGTVIEFIAPDKDVGMGTGGGGTIVPCAA
eukprot:CAMPEP_0184291176 /NCGR_PEP_ID=MMETSP1049-20130417/3250_1 /TAXON_ID=77928 /ORGANISM="Proteomonas sulcata, Strain CCMP704" /LENGTH=32 /DNA_ID= /DNA_START= /DNA_END= /DNA_ORIENTATION=